MGAYVLTSEGKEVPIVMGSYGIGVERAMAAAIELSHDGDGIIWPMTIAPFHVIIVPVNMTDEKQRAVAEKLYQDLQTAGVEVLFDDRDERAGVKFKDADLIGIPIRITLGPQRLKQGKVELTRRRTKESSDILTGDVVAKVKEIIESESNQPCAVACHEE
jgi:prolyl-tRNA synthetase